MIISPGQEPKCELSWIKLAIWLQLFRRVVYPLSFLSIERLMPLYNLYYSLSEWLLGRSLEIPPSCPAIPKSQDIFGPHFI